MSTSMPAASSTPAHATQASARPANVQGQSQRAQAPLDLFATLLALAADAAPTDAVAGDPLGDTAEAADTAQDPKDARGENPLAGLLLWQPPAAETTAHEADTTARAGRETAPVQPGLAEGHASEAAPAASATEASVAAPAATPNAARPQGPSWQVAAMRASQNTPAATGTSEAPAMRWSRSAPETAQIQAAWPVRSTVAMDPRFPAAADAHGAALAARDSDADAALLPAGEGARLGAPSGGASPVGGAGSAPQGDFAGGHMAGGEGSDSPARHDDNATQADNPYAAEADEAVEVQHWGGTHGLRHASLRVGEAAGHQAIDIQLALRGDEVQLDIRTDDSAAREALREQAQAALGERLQQGGLQLGSVSVGAQQQEGQREGHTPTTLRPGRAQADNPAEPATAPVQPAAGRAGGLDLFI